MEYYRLFKNSFQYEKYLDCINDENIRKHMPRFRLSSHSLEIETGRYSGVVRNERKCKLCNMNVCESEYHFLLCCPAYNCLRCTYKRRPSWPNLAVFVNIMSSHNIHTIHNLSKYIVEAMQFRNNSS